MSISAAIIDSREPEWVKKLNFGVPSSVTLLDSGDLWAVTDDGHTLMIERKTPDDFLNSLRDDRLIPQLARLADPRQLQQLKNEKPTYWPYLVITDAFARKGDKVYTPERGETGWSWNAVQGALLSIQEIGVQVVTCAGPSDYLECIRRLGKRSRDETMDILPPRQPIVLSAKEALLATLPGVGIERVVPLMAWGGGRVAHVLTGLTDLAIECPVEGIGPITRKKIRQFLGLVDGNTLEYFANQANDELIKETENKGANHE